MTSKPYKPPFTITPEIVNRIETIGESLGRISMAGDLSAVPHLRKNNRIRTVQASLNIEGNTLSLEQVTAILEAIHQALEELIPMLKNCSTS